MKCYACGEIVHMSWECPKNTPIAQRNASIAEAREESNEKAEMEKLPEEGESLTMKRVFVKTENEVHYPTQRNSLFGTKYKS